MELLSDSEAGIELAKRLKAVRGLVLPHNAHRKDDNTFSSLRHQPGLVLDPASGSFRDGITQLVYVPMIRDLLNLIRLRGADKAHLIADAFDSVFRLEEEEWSVIEEEFPPASQWPPLQDLWERRRACLGGSNLRLFYDPLPLQLVRGDGVHLWDASGRRFIDVYNNVASLGHCHPEILAAQINQARRLCTNTRYLTLQSVLYAERLLETVPNSGLDTVVLVSSGSEANDVAWRMAKVMTKRTGGLCVDGAYHGITDAVSNFTPSAFRGKTELPEHMRVFEPPDVYRNSLCSAEDAVNCANDIELAAVMIDSMFMSNGVLEAPKGYLKEIADCVHARGALYIADEVQSGFGRTGEAFWGFQAHGITNPDFVTIGKPAGNGHPLGAIITRREIVDEFQKSFGFFATFGGNNVACAVGTKVIDVIMSDELVKNAKKIGAYFKLSLERVSKAFKFVGDVRGTGLALGMELVKDPETKEPAKEMCLEFLKLLSLEGVLAGSDGQYGNVVKLRPALIFTKDDCDEALQGIERALQKLSEMNWGCSINVMR